MAICNWNSVLDICFGSVFTYFKKKTTCFRRCWENHFSQVYKQHDWKYFWSCGFGTVKNNNNVLDNAGENHMVSKICSRDILDVWTRRQKLRFEDRAEKESISNKNPCPLPPMYWTVHQRQWPLSYLTSILLFGPPERVDLTPAYQFYHGPYGNVNETIS